MSERRRPGVNRDPGEPREPTPEQKAIAKIDFFLSMRETLSGVVDKHVPTIRNWSEMTKKDQKKVKTIFLDGMLDEYIIQRLGEESEQAKELNRDRFIYGERDTYQNLLKEGNLLKILEGREKLYDNTAARYTKGDMLDITFKAFWGLRKASSEQREILFEDAGYTPDQRIGEKISIAAKDTAILSGVALVAEPVGVPLGALMMHDYFTNISEPRRLIEEGISYFVHYAPGIYTAWKSNQNLKDQDVRTCPNLWSTLLFLLLQKYHPKLAEFSVYLGTLGPTLAQEAIYGPLAFIPAAAGAVIVRNIMGASIFAGVGAFMNTEKGKRHLRGGR